MRYINSAIGRKQIMGLTGLLWAGFVLMHMLGNLLIIAGPKAYNSYGHAIISNPLLVLAEAGLVLTLLGHVAQGIKLTLKNKAARISKYEMATNGKKAARFQSKWMIFHGSILLVFIILHLAHFKFGAGEADGYFVTINGVQMRDLHRLVIETFHKPLFLGWYIVAMVIAGFHLSHGFYSAFASLGIYHPKLSPMLSKIGYVYSAVVALGFIVPPIYVFIAL